MTRAFLTIASLLGAVGVALGAFGAHGLRNRVDGRMLEVWETAVRYHLVHALALLAVAWMASRWPSPSLSLAGWLLVVGVAVFSGSLYLMALTGVRWLGAVTPIGGLCFLIGWIAVGLIGARRPSSS